MSDIQPEMLADYFADRLAARAAAVSDRLLTFTERERALIREAAVMGYVRGFMHGQTKPGFNERVPPDRSIVADVIDACIANAELYPTISGWTADEDEEPQP